ncbi:MAG TPA: Rieske 2Fe-2S domain-containing protein [Candidatus Binatia bacterium]|nr:Rieske 2Fe-2S domain-containing protein [Candidatus Binatia bacterium]
MSSDSRAQRRGERLNVLTQTGPDSDMGKLLRTFWHPIFVSRKLDAGKAVPVRLLSEDLTLYRGASGKPYLVGARCAHRLTVLHTGWIEGEQIRCMYHGWCYDGSGQCTERPAERDTTLPKIKIAGYPVHEYCGLIFAYMGDGSAPPFELPRKDAFERTGGILYARAEIWDCNWFQMVENSLDAVHVAFVHQKGRAGTFIQTVSEAIPELAYEETEAGIRQIATRAPGNVRVSDWTFPNNNHIVQPGLEKDDPWIDVGHWNVPIDDETTGRFNIWSVPATDPQRERRIRDYLESVADYNAVDHHDELFYEDKYPDDTVMPLTFAQDYVAQKGQGTIVDREHETLGRSDAGIAFLRRIFFREIEAIRNGEPPKQWRKLERPAEMPVHVA